MCNLVKICQDTTDDLADKHFTVSGSVFSRIYYTLPVLIICDRHDYGYYTVSLLNLV